MGLVGTRKGTGSKLAVGESFGYRESEASAGLAQGLELIELVIQRLEADSELFCGGGLVAGMAFDRFMDGNFFELFEAHRSELDGIATEASIGEMAREMFGEDRWGIAEDGGMFDDVGKFANVTGPDVILQLLQRGRIEEDFAVGEFRTAA